jgi:mono/diheme cytochrome c family protein
MHPGKRHKYALPAAYAALAIVAFSALSPAAAQNAQRGRDLYFTLPGTTGSPSSCAGCHSSPPDSIARRAANNPGLIATAVGQNKGAMGYIGQYMVTADYVDVAAYLANPSAVGNPPPSSGGSGSGSTATTSEPTNVGGGGCTIAAGRTSLVDPLLALMAALATGVLAWRLWQSRTDRRASQTIPHAEKT